MVVAVHPVHEGVGMILDRGGSRLHHEGHDLVEDVTDPVNEHLDVVAEFAIVGRRHDEIVANNDKSGEMNCAAGIEWTGEAIGKSEHLCRQRTDPCIAGIGERHDEVHGPLNTGYRGIDIHEGPLPKVVSLIVGTVDPEHRTCLVDEGDSHSILQENTVTVRP